MQSLIHCLRFSSDVWFALVGHLQKVILSDGESDENYLFLIIKYPCLVLYMLWVAFYWLSVCSQFFLVMKIRAVPL